MYSNKMYSNCPYSSLRRHVDCSFGRTPELRPFPLPIESPLVTSENATSPASSQSVATN